MLKATTTLLAFVAAVGVLTVPSVSQTVTKAKTEVTFSKDIAPLLQRSCQNCHRPDSVAPMSLLTYEQARPFARAMKQKTALARTQYQRGAMPPSFYEKNIGIQKLKDDISLSDEEIAKFAAWADEGAPEGNKADLPPPLKFASSDEWTLGKPDIIIKSPIIHVKGIGPDDWGVERSWDRQPLGLTEDRYIASVEWKEVTTSRGSKRGGTVGGRFVFHHSNASILNPGEAEDPTIDAESGTVATALPGQEVGRNGDLFPANAGRLAKAGSYLAWGNTHIHSPGVAGDDRDAHLEIGLRFHPKGYKPEFQVVPIGFGRSEIVVKASNAEQKTDAYYVTETPIKLVNFEPHLHAAGVRMCLEAVEQRTIETLSCAGYDHNWVKNYYYDDNAAPLLPKGTILHAIAWWDNTPKNANILESRNTTTWDRRSVGNMFIVFEQAIALTDEQYRAEIAKRRQYQEATGQPPIGCPGCFLVPPGSPVVAKK